MNLLKGLLKNFIIPSIFFSFILYISTVNNGIIVNAINIEDSIAYIRVKDNGLNIEPTNPLMNIRGNNTTNVVSAPAILGNAISSAASIVAVIISLLYLVL